MNHLSKFLNRFKNFGLNEQISKEAIVNEISKLVAPGLVTKKDVTIKNKTANIKSSGVLKSEIILHKAEILNRCRGKLGKSFLVDEIR